MYFAEIVRSFATEPLSEPDEEPAPAPDQYNRQSSAFVRLPSASLPWPPSLELPASCDKSAGRFDEEPPVAPEEEEVAPNPAPYKSQRSLPPAELPVFVPLPCPPAFEPPVYCDESTGLFGSGLLLVTEGDEPAADPVPLKRAGPYGVDPLVLPAEGAPLPEPVPLNITGLFGGKLLLPPDVEEPVPDPVPL